MVGVLIMGAQIGARDIPGGHCSRAGGFAFAVQLHREVKPESGLVGIVEHIVVNKKVTALMWYRLMS